jgi:hypothetical protein
LAVLFGAMTTTIFGLLGLVIVLVAFILAIWALRHQSRQYPPGTRIPTEEERRAEPRGSAWTHQGREPL